MRNESPSTPVSAQYNILGTKTRMAETLPTENIGYQKIALDLSGSICAIPLQ